MGRKYKKIQIDVNKGHIKITLCNFDSMKVVVEVYSVSHTTFNLN